MYRPATADRNDPAVANEIIDAHPFALLITADASGALTTSHLPILRDEDCLVGHVALQNPHARLEAATALAIFQGPHGYVSPTWYGRPEQHVPTWNYVAVHVSGRLEALKAEETALAVDRMVERFEAVWTVAPDVSGKLSGGIRGFRLRMDHVETRLKLSQNRDEADAVRVSERFRRTEPALATWMRRALQGRKGG
jgi:transcriptional regulator